MTKIYIDSLFILNYIISHLLIALTAHFGAKTTRQRRIVFSALVGAVFSFYIFAPINSTFLHILVKFVSAMVMVLVAFGFGSIKRFTRLVGLFLGFTLLFGGLFLLLAELMPKNIRHFSNGVVYIDFSPIIFLLSAGACFLVIETYKRISFRKAQDGCCTVNLKIADRQQSCTVLLDNGHSLRDLFSDLPVLVLSANQPLSLLSESERTAVINKDYPTLLKAGYRLIPCKTVAATGVLPVRKADYASITLSNGEKITFKTCVGFTENKLSDDFSGIVSPCIFDEV